MLLRLNLTDKVLDGQLGGRLLCETEASGDGGAPRLTDRLRRDGDRRLGKAVKRGRKSYSTSIVCTRVVQLSADKVPPSAMGILKEDPAFMERCNRKMLSSVASGNTVVTFDGWAESI